MRPPPPAPCASQRRAGPDRTGDDGGLRCEVLAGIDETIALEPVLFVVQLPIAAAFGNQLVVRPAFADLAGFEYQDLIGALDGRQAVRDHECRSAAPQG